MTRKVLASAAVIVATSIFAGQGAANAGTDRMKSETIGMNAPVKKVDSKDDGSLAIGKNPHSIYTWKHGDPPGDSSGSTVYAGHAWKKGNGVADDWGKFRPHDIIRVSGCKFEVTKKVEYWSIAKTKKKMKRLYRVDGPPLIYLVGCKPDNYSKRTIVTARLVSCS